MNVTTPLIPTDIELPEWLKSCLISDASPVVGDSSENPRSDAHLVCSAFEFAYRLHENQYRQSGEPYIAHPVAVAGLLRDLGGSGAMIAAGFLHDVVEDTDVTLEDIEQRFGEEVKHLVEGVTKLSKFNFSSKTERQAENFRRMFLAMAQDIRVIVVKLADRLHNMRTLEYLPDEKRRRIAQETMDIFAPLANRLGIGRFKWELEDLSFKYLEPEAYRSMQNLVIEKRANREAFLDEATSLIRPELEHAGIKVHEISGRPKHLYGIYQKMQRQQKEFHEIFDIAAIRIIVQTKDECYRTLAFVHDLFRPIPGRFKDYIGLPKPNRYQSLHTVVIGLRGRPVEVQIRTVEMHHIAEYGIAAHWKYKEVGHSSSKLSTEDEKFTWLRQLIDWQSDLKDAQEYLDNVRTNLFDDDVYVFTPHGDVVALSQKSTPVDFAYRIHTEVGNHCAGAKINGRIVPLGTQLHNGDIVEIITQKNSHPSLDWLNFTVTTGARNRIRQWYKRSNREQNIQRGRDMLEKELGKQGFEALLKSEPMHATAQRCNYHSVDDLLAALGYGETTLNLTINRLREEIKARQPIAPATEEKGEDVGKLLNAAPSAPVRPSHRTQDCPIVGVEGLLYNLAGCCNPLPGEAIIGVVTLGSRGISIHRQGCPNTDTIPGDRLIPVRWNKCDAVAQPQTYPVQVQIEVIDRVGVLKDILSRLSDYNINVRSAQVKTFPGSTAIINLGIDIRDHDQLERTFTQIRKMSDVIQLRRVSEGEEPKPFDKQSAGHA
ncbi:RelA/SpoT family protein [Leptolyngbya sp. AN02str]|uniref:RelA/SpoT family protein n=1 Tax=Leptolyngbya sp. AN02str TaxID=3423363 RepID=UPI003D319DE3